MKLSQGVLLFRSYFDQTFKVYNKHVISILTLSKRLRCSSADTLVDDVLRLKKENDKTIEKGYIIEQGTHICC